jgi:hypothetical protein
MPVRSTRPTAGRKRPLKRGRAASSSTRVYGRGSYKSIQKTASRIGRLAERYSAPVANLAMLAGNPQLAAAINLGGAASGILAGPPGGNKMSGNGVYNGSGFSGMGSYKSIHGYAAGNSLIDGMGSGVPTFSSKRDETGALTLTHSEFLQDIHGNDSDKHGRVIQFKSIAIPLNPGLAQFPFLSQIACNFEEYEFIQLMFSYKSKVNESITSTDGQTGSILMYTDYNPLADLKTGKQSMLQCYGTTNMKVTDSGLHGVECDPKKISGDGHKFIRTHPQNDLNSFDAGSFQLAVCSTPAALSKSVIGELHVSYTVRLRKPRVYSLYAKSVQRDEHSVVHQKSSYVRDPLNEAYRSSDNSIGTRIFFGEDGFAPTLGVIHIMFPATVAGVFQIFVTKSARTGASSQGIVRTIGSDFRTGGHAGAEEGNAKLTFFGQTAEFDSAVVLPLDSPTYDQWNNVGENGRFASHIDSTNDDNQRWLLTAYVRVEQATNGVDNVISVPTPYGVDFPTMTTVAISRYADNGRRGDGSDVAKHLKYPIVYVQSLAEEVLARNGINIMPGTATAQEPKDE